MKLLVILLLISSAAHSAVLNTLITQSWQEDGFIKAQENKIKAAELDRFARYLPNNPMVSYADSDNKSWKTYGVSLVVGLPGKAFALSNLDKQMVRAEHAEMAAKKNEIATFILSNYSECASNTEILKVLAEATDELSTLEKTITARYESGQSTQSERIGIQLQLRQATIEFNAAKDHSKIACQKLDEIVKNLKSPVMMNAEELTLPDDLEPSITTGMGHISADVLRAENDLRFAQVKHSTAVWENLPDVTLSYFRNYYNKVVASPIIPTQWTSTYMISLNIPLFYPFYNGNDIRVAKAESIIAERRAFMRKIEAEKTMQNASRDFKRNKDILKRLRDHDLPMAEVMVDSTLAAYRTGRLGFSELILAKRTWLDLKKEEVNLKVALLNDRMLCLSACDLE